MDTGIVYTGIPGYGLCSISPDLKTWRRLGSDERLKGNIHGIVVYKHKGTTYIAVAQNNDSRVLVLGLDGSVLQQLDIPTGGEFDFGPANGADTCLIHTHAHTTKAASDSQMTPSTFCTHTHTHTHTPAYYPNRPSRTRKPAYKPSFAW